MPAAAHAAFCSALELLSRPAGSWRALARAGIEVNLPPEHADCLEVRVRYRGYIERQRRVAERSAALDRMPLDDSLWALDLVGLSAEAREKLVRWRPATVGQAGRIAGVSPADVAVLLIHAKKLAGSARRALFAAAPDEGIGAAH